MSDGDGGPPDGRKGFREGIESSEGDPRVLLVLNAVLSGLFAWAVVAGGSLLDLMAFSASNVVTVALVVFAMTYVITRQ